MRNTKTWKTKTWNTITRNTKSWNTKMWNTKTRNTKTRNTKTWNTKTWNTKSWNTKTWKTKTRKPPKSFQDQLWQVHIHFYQCTNRRKWYYYSVEMGLLFGGNSSSWKNGQIVTKLNCSFIFAWLLNRGVLNRGKPIGGNVCTIRRKRFHVFKKWTIWTKSETYVSSSAL